MNAPHARESGDGHLRTDGLHADLKRRAVRSGLTTILAQGVTGLVAFGSTLVLARLLRPEDFGLVAMALPVALLGSVLRNFGLDVVVIQRGELNERQVSGLFWLSCRLNGWLGAGLAALAPLLGWLYADGRVTRIALALAAGVVVVGLGGLPEALLKRQMRFGVLAAITTLAALGAAVGAIGLALQGAGVWALVSQILITHLILGAGTWICCAWRPLPPASSNVALEPGWRPMLAYGRNLTLSRLLTLAASFADRICVGWLAGPTLLGFYENGRRLPFFLLDRLYDACFGVAVAGFSRAGHDPKRYRGFATRALQLVLGLLLPALVFLLVEAEPVTRLLLGEQWGPAVPFARWLAVAAIAHGFLRTLQWFHLSQDRTARQLRWTVIQTVVLVAAVGIGAAIGGPSGVAPGFAVAAVLLAGPAVAYGLAGSPFSAVDFARACARPVLCSLLAGGGLGALELAGWQSSRPALHVPASGAVFGFLYFATWLATAAGRAQAGQLLQLLRTAIRGGEITPPRPPPDPRE